MKDNTLVDQYRCYELWQLTRQLATIPGAILEVGVWRGGTGGILCAAAKSAGVAEPVYLCDTFAGVPKAGEADSRYTGSEHADTNRETVLALIAELGLSNARVIQGIFPDESAGSITADTFRLAHIDVDVYESARDVLAWLWPRLSPGGVVVFDDYGFVETCDGITRFVNEQYGSSDRLVVYNLNGHAILVKR